MPIAREDLEDVGFVDEIELASSGSTVYRSDAITDVVSGTVSLTGTVELANTDNPVESGDIVVITGSTAADGTYTVDTVTDVHNGAFTVVEAISDSTGGSASFRHPPGATRVGVDPANLAYTSATNLQEVLEDISVGGGSYTSSIHRAEDQLVHLISEDSYEEYVYSSGKIQTITVWTDNGKTKKIREETYTHSGNQVTQIVTVHYDGAGAAVTGETMTEAFNYSGNTVTSIDRTVV